MLGQVVLGKYRVSRLLDQGGMCKVWLARQTDLPRDVVVKVLQEQLRTQSRPREYFRREIHIHSRFQHPNAATYYDSDANAPQGPVLVMEYLRGLDLAGLLRRDGRLTPERAGRLLAQLCDVLGAAHHAGIVHCDVKPGNLMVLYPGTPQETLKLMDFGLATMSSLLYLGAENLGDVHRPAASGTPEYIAPEQVRGQDMGPRGDLYSAGVVLYEMLTGRRPFEHETTDALLCAHLEESPPSFAERGVTGVPAAVEVVVRGCLAKFPDQRPRDAAELAQRYEHALGRPIMPRGSHSGTINVKALQAAAGRATAAPPAGPPRTVADHHAVRQEFVADMPEAMALIKLKGFLHDLGSEVIESVPGLIRVRLGAPDAAAKKSGLFRLFDRDQPRPGLSAATTEVELRLERRDPSRPTALNITLIMRPRHGLAGAEWRSRSQKIATDLKAYLMGR